MLVLGSLKDVQKCFSHLRKDNPEEEKYAAVCIGKCTIYLWRDWVSLDDKAGCFVEENERHQKEKEEESQ